MKTIKFRALKDDMSNCNFVYGFLVKDEEGNPYIVEYTSDKGYKHQSCIKGTEGQFTEQTDKNGNEIFEGDLLSDGEVTYKVIWDRNNTRFKLEVISYILETDNDFISFVFNQQNLGNGYFSRKDLEIIGNIHENTIKSHEQSRTI